MAQQSCERCHMSEDIRPYRSVLYLPGSKQRALEKARPLPVDAIILDLEEAVTPEAKPAACKTPATAQSEGGYGARVQIVRINGLDNPVVARRYCGAGRL